jgi:hypothetical protein
LARKLSQETTVDVDMKRLPFQREKEALELKISKFSREVIEERS